MEYRANWLGQIDVVCRIILGYDGRMRNFEFFKSQKEEKQKKIAEQLKTVENEVDLDKEPDISGSECILPIKVLVKI